MSKDIKLFLRRKLGQLNYGRLQILHRAIVDLRKTFEKTNGYPIPVDVVRQTLIDLGVKSDDLIIMHSSISHLFTGWKMPPRKPVNVIQYARDIIDMVMDLVGKEGTILMNTDSLSRDILYSIWEKTENDSAVFNYAKSPSIRGIISEIFRRRSDVIRSVHPMCNVAGWGKYANELIKDHSKSTPYAMDRHSPWYKIQNMGGKGVILGTPYGCGNSLVHFLEFFHHEEFPREIFFQKPVKLKYVDYAKKIREMDIMLHASVIGRFGNGEANYYKYLNAKYGIFKFREFKNSTRITCYDSREQYEAMYKEMEKNITWFDRVFQTTDGWFQLLEKEL